MEQFWGASKAFWLYRWTTVYEICGGNSFLLYVAGTARPYSHSYMYNMHMHNYI